jgi:hypothetical protein
VNVLKLESSSSLWGNMGGPKVPVIACRVARGEVLLQTSEQWKNLLLSL